MLYVKKIVLAAFVLLTVNGLLYAQQQERPSIEAHFSADSVLIGDQFQLEVQIRKDMMEIVEFPSFDKGHLGDSSHIEILGESKIDTLETNGRNLLLRKAYTLTCFDEANYHLGRFPVLYVDKNVADTLWSNDSLRIVVTTLPVDTVKQKIYDVKAPIHTPVRFGEFSGYLATGVAVALLLAVIIYLIVKRLRKRPLLNGKKGPAEPPHVTAIKQLEKLHAQKLWQSGKHKQYYTCITDILREYLSNRYPIKAMELTSQEILERMAGESLTDKSMQRLRDVLITADFVKFAKYTPEGDQNETAYTESYYFIEETKAGESVQPEETAESTETDKKEGKA